jgi:hypothetical protein
MCVYLLWLPCVSRKVRFDLRWKLKESIWMITLIWKLKGFAKDAGLYIYFSEPPGTRYSSLREMRIDGSNDSYIVSVSKYLRPLSTHYLSRNPPFFSQFRESIMRNVFI